MFTAGPTYSYSDDISLNVGATEKGGNTTRALLVI